MLASLAVSPLWSIVLFALFISAALNTQMLLMGNIVTAVCDEFAEQLRRNHRHVLSAVCLVFFGVGLVFCTHVS